MNIVSKVNKKICRHKWDMTNAKTIEEGICEKCEITLMDDMRLNPKKYMPKNKNKQ